MKRTSWWWLMAVVEKGKGEVKVGDRKLVRIRARAFFC
jgi:hypothetical protein